MERDDLRVLISSHKDTMGRPHYEYGSVTDADLASLGYVKVDDLDKPGWFQALATRAGYVKRPVCENCGGSGESERQHIWLGYAQPVTEVGPCPVCSGSGFGRLVALDGIDVERVARLFHENYERLAPDFGYATRTETRTPWPPSNADLMIATVAAVLAAIDQEDTDGR